MDEYTIPTDDLLYGLLEECVRREQEWRRRFTALEKKHEELGAQAAEVIRQQRMQIDQLQGQCQQMGAAQAGLAAKKESQYGS